MGALGGWLFLMSEVPLYLAAVHGRVVVELLLQVRQSDLFKVWGEQFRTFRA